MDNKKAFGLVIPKKTQTFIPKTSGVFGSDSDDDLASKKKSTKIPQSRPLSSKSTSALTAIDPSIYEYDSIYDEMKAEKTVEVAPKVKKSSRYIDHLLKAADKRKKEYERRVEKKVQIEREKEGDKYKDKEMFVTAGYKKKMQEREEEEERERRENMLNDMMDVTKQKDLSGFYRHFLSQSVGEEKIPVFGERNAIKEEPLNDPEIEKVESSKDHDEPVHDYDDRDFSDDGSSSSEDADNSYEKSMRLKLDEQDKDLPPIEKPKNVSNSESQAEFSKKSPDKRLSKGSKIEKKHFRSSNKSSSSDDDSDQSSEVELKRKSFDKHLNKELSHKRKNSEKFTDKDSDFEDLNFIGNKSLEKHADIEKSHKRKMARRDSSESSSSHHSEKNVNSKLSADETSLNGALKAKESKKSASGAKTSSIYEKRTVGDVFTCAQTRYYQRLASRSG